MRYINENYISESRNLDGEIMHISLHYDKTFNWAYDVVDDIAVNDPHRPAMVWCNPEGEEHRFSFGEMKFWSDKCANFLVSQGIRKGDMVLVILRRHYQFWITALALHKIGAVLVPATFMLREHDLEYRLNAASCKAVVCTDAGAIADVVDAVAPNCPDLQKKIIVAAGGAGLAVSEPGFEPSRHRMLSGPEHICELTCEREGWVDFNSGVRAASDFWGRVPIMVDEPLIMYFSSGTSGNPKMVLHNGTYALAHTITAKLWHNVIGDGGLHFTIADTGWGKAVWGKFYGAWTMESCVFTYDFDRFSGDEILSLIGRYHVTTLCCPPTMYRLMMQSNVDAHDLSSLRYCTTAGEALNPDLYDFWRNHTGLTIYEGFGQTETPLTIANLNNAKPRPGSMGKIVPLYDIQVLRDDGSKCEDGETGEICIRYDKENPPAGIMMEYYRNPEKTDEAIHDGWYHTGDTAWRDEDDYLWYVGRNDDVIKSSGYRIGPTEIESVLLQHPAVRECAVTGVPDPVRGKAVKATIVLHEGYAGSPELTKELQTYVKRETAPYKYPRIIDYVRELPKTVNGKIRRVAIRKRDEEAAKIKSDSQDKADGLI
ncbi:MAG: AMP-binding protein [Atopobiaceae bacterium]|nr:AMP-binding protein [Atopobiaceae bacterium]